MSARWQRPARPRSPGWWVHDAAGDLVLGQRPNLLAVSWSATTAVALLPVLPPGARAAGSVAADVTGALWAIQEIRTGVTPARSVLGAVVLARQASRLVRRYRAS